MGKNRAEEALRFYLRSLDVAQHLSMHEHVSDVSKKLAALYKAKGDFRNALLYRELYATSYDSVFNHEKNKQIEEMQARFETENKEKEIDALKKDQHINKIYRVTGVIFFLLLTIISVLIINHQRLGAKKNDELSRKEKLLLEKEVEKQKLAEEKLRFTIEHNNKSLTAYTLNLIHKNEVLDDIKTQVQQIRILPEPELRMSLNSLLKAVNYSVHLDKDWDNFKHHFEQVHQGFFDKLKEQYPGLSPYDLRLCSLVKLNLETKQIATLLDISIESAKVARSRVRKKMGLQVEQNLQEFLQTF
jgi:DNA-binding CsgD family transcriptional regulator